MNTNAGMDRHGGKARGEPAHGPDADLRPFAQEFRGALMLEALIAGCAVISYTDRKSSLIERWRLLDVLARDPLLAALPKAAVAEEWGAHRQAFAADADAAREAALRQVARLAPEPQKARMVLDACIRIASADKQASPEELRALRDIAAALQL